MIGTERHSPLDLYRYGGGRVDSEHNFIPGRRIEVGSVNDAIEPVYGRGKKQFRTINSIVAAAMDNIELTGRDAWGNEVKEIIKARYG